MSLDVNLAAAFAAGLLSFLSPCILPLVPPYLTWLAGASLAEMTAETPPPGTARRAVVRALAFVLGFSTVFVALGASASVIGQLLLDHVAILSRIAGVVIVVFGLHFVGAFRIPLLYREARFAAAAKPVGLLGAFVLGLAFAFGWTPCVGPVLASILMVAGAEDTAARGALLLGGYALGIGVPFLAAAAFVRPFLGFLARFRRHLGVIEKVVGVLLIVTGVLIFTRTMADVGGWLLELVPALGRIG
ncbi:cytochrome c biogenesis CcdA family protein [Blastochloris sulfoviridis]|uniref:Cytochrome c biogenesis protein CcdA n=1 Tax=Blastochloris sulfoviridis TaxID=50712 RepID=A0A5M6HKX1_9HYPH|nr:cytochrome c biogenesis protein CcdA [Blastochloris sulfoviridis]KAA5596239.1 cytochrome c biogenesis protein CcdA [Blastochloris sulfoviridis]